MAALTIHQVQDETQFIRGVEGICHTHYERTILQIKKEIEKIPQMRQGCYCAVWVISTSVYMYVSLTPVLTNDSMILSLSASVSPCFILIRFLSKHFMAYLRHTVSEHILLSKPQKSIFLVSSLQQHLHFPCVSLSASIHLSKTPSTNDPMHAEVIHCQLHAKSGATLNKSSFKKFIKVHEELLGKYSTRENVHGCWALHSSTGRNAWTCRYRAKEKGFNVKIIPKQQNSKTCIWIVCFFFKAL